MKRFLIILGVILVLLIAVVVALPFVVPKSTMVAFVSDQVEQATGRKLTIGGEPSFSVFPSVALSVSDVALSNAEGGSAPSLARIKSADIEVDLWAALSGDVVIKRFVLVEPVIHVEKDAQGRFNFEFDQGPAGKAQAPAPDAQPGGEVPPLQIDSVRLENATLTYDDATTDEHYELTGFNAQLSLPSMQGPFNLEADGKYLDRVVKVTANIDKPQALMGSGESAVDLATSSDGLFNVTFKGTAAAGEAPKGAGRLSASAEDIAGLMAWLGAEAGPGVKLPQSASLEGDVNGNPKLVTVDKMALKFDENQIDGNVRADLGGQKPSVLANLKAGDLDFRPYLPEDAGKQDGDGGGEAAPAKSDWSDEPIDFSALDTADVQLNFVANSILSGIVDTGATDIGVVGKGGNLSLAINKLALYEGEAKGGVNINRGGGTPKIALNLNADGIQAQPALQQLADYGDFLGTVKSDMSFTTTGKSERELVSALNGKGAVQITDGAIIGYNLAAAVRNISRGGLELDYDEAEKTDFAEIAGSFNSTKGVLKNEDFRMNAPLLRMTGAGTVSLPERQIDYGVLPKLVASLQGQGASGSGGAGIPLIIQGPLDNPSIRPDFEGVLKGVLKDPSEIAEGAASTVKSVTEGGGNAVKNVLEGATEGGAGGQDEGESGSPVQEGVQEGVKKLKGLFGD